MSSSSLFPFYEWFESIFLFWYEWIVNFYLMFRQLSFMLLSITAFFKHNWRWLHTRLFFNYLFEANFTLPLEALRLKVWSLNVGHSQPQLFSDLLVWFLGGCQHGSRSLAQESVEVSRYLLYSYSNMIGLLTTGLRQLIYSLLVIGLIEKSVGW